MNCLGCDTELKDYHKKKKYCDECKKIRSKNIYIPGCLSEEQQKQIDELVGIMSIRDIAKTVGTSRSSVKRYGNHKCYKFMIYKYTNEFKKELTDYYVKHGKRKTVNKFPNAKIRSIVERVEHIPRQIRWTDEQIVTAVKMADLVPNNMQAMIFNRPNAYSGSIKSLWTKRIGVGQTYINGARMHFLKSICCKKIVSGLITIDSSGQCKVIIPWTIVFENLKKDLPDWIKQAINSLANFQKWLHGTKNIEKSLMETTNEYWNKIN